MIGPAPELGPTEDSSRDSETRGRKRKAEDTSIGDVTDLAAKEEQTFWHTISPILETIEAARTAFEELQDIGQRESMAVFFGEQVSKMAKHADEVKRLRPLKRQRTSLQQKPPVRRYHGVDPAKVQRAIESLSLIQTKTGNIFKALNDPEGEKTINAQFLSPLLRFRGFLEKVFPVSSQNIPTAEEVEALNQALTTTNSIPPEKRPVIQKLLERAIGNRDLNTVLREKNPESLSDAENFLLALSYTTMQAPTCTQQMNQLERMFKQTKAREFSDSVKEYKKTERAIQGFLSAITKEKGNPWIKQTDLTDLYDELSALESKLAPLGHSPLVAQQLHQQRLKLLNELETKLNRLLSAQGPPEHVKKLATKSLQAIREAISKLDALLGKQQEYETGLQNGSLHPPLSLRDYWIVRRHGDLYDKFRSLQKRSVSFKEPPLQKLLQESLDARKKIADLRTFFDSLPSFCAGDILFTDDGRSAIQEGKIPITDLREAKAAFQQVFEATGDINAAIWPLRALGSMGVRHVSHTFVAEDTPMCLEMGDTCDRSKISLIDGQLSVPFRPQFLNLLTEEAKKVIKERFKQASDEEIERDLLQLHATCLDEYLRANEEKFKTFDNRSALHAVKAFIGKPLAEMPEGSLMRQLFDWANQKFSKLLTSPSPMQTEESSQGSPQLERLCSELVAEVIRDVQQEMERKIQQQYGVSIPIFRPVIPADKKLSTYTIDTLLEDLKKSGAYFRAKEPLAIRLFIDLPQPCQVLRQ
jgi:hypothetical protein